MTSTLRDFHLSILDQTMLRMYVRHLIIFQFPDLARSEDAVRALRTGFSATLQQMQFLAGTIGLSDVRTGRLSLQYPDPIPEELLDKIFTANFDLAENNELEYETLEREGFPPSRLPNDVFCPKLLRNHPGLDDPFAEGLISFTKGHPVPVLAAQANFIAGGLVLSVYSNHNVVDGNGIAQIYRIWSAFVQSQAQIETPNLPNFFPIVQDSDHTHNMEFQRHALDNLAESTTPIDCPEVRFPGTPPRTPALRSTPYNVAARIFVFSALTISNLTSTLSSITQTHISNFTALITLLWTQITLSRSSILLEKNVPNTTLSIAFDHRKNLGHDFTKMGDYVGNCATGITTTSPVSAMLSQKSSHVDAQCLAPIALDITNTLSSITLSWLQPRLSLFSQTPNSHQLSLDINIANGPDLFVTSWQNMGADCAWNIPGTTSEIPKAIRKPRSRVEGNIHILPRSRAGDGNGVFEVMVGLEEREMERVERRLEMEGWVEKVVDA